MPLKEFTTTRVCSAARRGRRPIARAETVRIIGRAVPKEVYVVMSEDRMADGCIIREARLVRDECHRTAEGAFATLEMIAADGGIMLKGASKDKWKVRRDMGNWLFRYFFIKRLTLVK